MDRTKRNRRTMLFGAAAIAGAALAVAGCGSSSSSTRRRPGPRAPGQAARFAALPYNTWCTNSKLCTYISKGSGGGITDFTNGVVDWGATDSPLKPSELATLAKTRNGVTPIYFPTFLGAIGVPTNVSGATVAAVLGQDAGRHLRRHRHHLEQPRDRRRQPGRHAPERRDHGVRACRFVRVRARTSPATSARRAPRSCRRSAPPPSSRRGPPRT